MEQTVDSCSEQGGELLLSVTARYLASDGDYYTVHYRVDPATNEVLEASVTDYIKRKAARYPSCIRRSTAGATTSPIRQSAM